jgi:glucose-1-phosphate adenylyltransferase
VVPVPIKECRRFGVVTMNAESRVTGFAEKPAVPASNLASMGIYIFSARVLADCLVEDSRDRGSVHDFGHSIIPKLVKNNRVFAFKYDRYWRDIGTAGAYHAANMDILRQSSPLALDKSWPVVSAGTNDFPARVFNSGNISRSLLSPGCIIKGKVINSLLAPGVVVDNNAVVRNSVIMANTFVGRNTVIDRCILDEEVTTGESCRIGKASSYIYDDIIVLDKRSVVRSYCSIPRDPAATEVPERTRPAVPAEELVLA